MRIAGHASEYAANVTWLYTGSDGAKGFIGGVGKTTAALGKMNEGKVTDAALEAGGALKDMGEGMFGKGNPVSEKFKVASTLKNVKTAYEGISGIREGYADQAAITARNEHAQQRSDQIIDEETRKFWEYERGLEQIRKELDCFRALP
jgi:hypothetical protein